jgi:prepilin-type processing-associated H-X9-DG protein
MMGAGQVDAGANAAVNNVKELGIAALSYAQDFDETLPGADWVDATRPYRRGDQILRNPARPELAVAYAMNQDVAGLALADIPDPSRTVLFFGSDTAEQAPVAGADALSVAPEGSAVIGFVDGHVQLIPIDQALQNLIWNPLEQ